MINEKLKSLLYKSFDGQLTDSERKLLEHELIISHELKKEKEKIEQLRLQLSETEQPEFSDSFVDNVMSLLKPRTELGHDEFFDSIMFSFKRVAISAMAIILVLLSIKLTQTESLDEIFGQSNLTIEDVSNPIYYFD